MNDKPTGTGKIIGAAIAGAAIGALIGILFAPASGRETRRKVAEAAEDFERKMKKKRYPDDEDPEKENPV